MFEKVKDTVRGFGSVGLGMLAGYGILGLIGGDPLLGIVLIVVGAAGIAALNGVVDTPLDMTTG
jgi:hypothetical protein